MCGICGGRSRTGTDSSARYFSFSSKYYFTVAPYSYDRHVCDVSTDELKLHSLTNHITHHFFKLKSTLAECAYLCLLRYSRAICNAEYFYGISCYHYLPFCAIKLNFAFVMIELYIWCFRNLVAMFVNNIY